MQKMFSSGANFTRLSSRFWRWLTREAVIPWALAALGASYAIGQLDQAVQAQDQKIQETAESLDRHQVELRNRIDEIHMSIRQLDEKVDVVQDKAVETSADLRIVCDKLKAPCRK